MIYFKKTSRRCHMAVKVKSFGMEIRPLKTTRELEELDNLVNQFISATGIKKVLSVSDTATTDDKGETIGLVRVVAYEE
jgi:hypothetical protein